MPDPNPVPPAADHGRTDTPMPVLTFPLEMLDHNGRVIPVFQLGTTPTRPGAPVLRALTKTSITSWSFA